MRYIPSILVLLGTLQYAFGQGTLKIKFKQYRNPDGTGANGQCCDGKFGICPENACDYEFTICLDSSRGESLSQCSMGKFQSNSISDQNNIDFGSKIGQVVQNPITIPFSGSTPEVMIKIKVMDDDGFLSAADEVDYLSYMYVPKTVDVQVTAGERTELDMDISVECSPYHYGAHCTSCPPSNQYTCLPDGTRVCTAGWSGISCDKQVVVTTPPPPVFRDFAEFDCETRARHKELLKDGVYIINPIPQHSQFVTYCDKDLGEHGWTLIQRNVNNEVTFDKIWYEYKQGFGLPSPGNNYWIGLDAMHYMTTARNYKLKIVLTLVTGDKRYAHYDQFSIGPEWSNYKIDLNGYSGNAGDAFNYRLYGNVAQNGKGFSTEDNDNDDYDQGNCAQRYDSGWWYGNCYRNNLNGPILSESTNEKARCENHKCLAWKTIPGYEYYSLQGSEMWIIPSDVTL